MANKNSSVADADPVAVIVKEKEEGGFICPCCRFPMRVYRTKKFSLSAYRERICDRCGHKMETEEKPI